MEPLLKPTGEARGDVEDDVSCELCGEGKNSCGILSDIINCIIWFLPSPVERLIRWRPPVSSVKWSDVESKSDVRTYYDANVIQPPCIFNWAMIRSSVLLQWTYWNDEHISDLKENQKSALTNIALVSALSFGVIASFLMLGDNGEGSSVSGNSAYVLTMAMAMWLCLIATLVAVLYIMILDELADDEEARQFVDRMGFVMLIPVISFVLAGSLASVGGLIWLAQNVGVTITFYIMLVGPLFFAFLGILPYFYAVQSFWVVIKTSQACKGQCKGDDRPIAYGLADIQRLFGEYQESVGGVEHILLDDFIEFLEIVKPIHEGELPYYNKLASVTKKRAEKIFNENVDEILHQSGSTSRYV